jgi:hypothetical protein
MFPRGRKASRVHHSRICVLMPISNRRVTSSTSGEGVALRDVLVHDTQDHGIEAVRSGAGRDDYDQHKGIKRLG